MSERLTCTNDKGCNYVDCNCSGDDAEHCFDCPVAETAMEKLQAYENCFSLERAQELAEAERDGRLVVLPCKPGDIVFCNIGGHTYEGYVDCWGIYENKCIIGVRVDNIARSCTWGKTVFLTREAAMNGGDGDG